MIAFIVAWLICSVISFIVYGVEQLIINKYYTLRDVFMGLLMAVGGPLYTIFCIAGVLGTYVAKLIFIIEEFIKDKDMYAHTVIIDQVSILYKIKNLLKK